MTPSVIEPATFRFIAQYLNHCATAVFHPVYTDQIKYRLWAILEKLLISIRDIGISKENVVRCEGKRKFCPVTGHEGTDGEQRYTSTLFYNLGACWEGVVNATPRPLYPQERNPIPLVEEAGWAPGTV
jgi:hypothetical protein